MQLESGAKATISYRECAYNTNILASSYDSALVPDKTLITLP